MKALLLLIAAIVLGIGLWSFTGPEEAAVVREKPVQAVIEEKAAPADVVVSQPAKRSTGEAPVAEARPTDFQQVWDMISDGRKEDAIALLEQKIKENPNDEAALTELGVILAGDTAQAAKGIETLAKAIELNPENDRALGDILFTKMSPELQAQTISRLKALQEANPDSANLAAGLGRMLLKQGDRAGAVNYLEKGSRDPKFAESSLSALIDTYRELGQPGQSTDAYARLIAEQERKLASGQAPRNLEGTILNNRLGLANALIDAGQLDSADQILQRVREQAPNNSGLIQLTQKLSQKRAG